MAKTKTPEAAPAEKMKPGYRACPNCGKPVHIRAGSHECGWTKPATEKKPPKATKGTPGRKKGSRNGQATDNETIVMLDHADAIRKAVERLGPDVVKAIADRYAK